MKNCGVATPFRGVRVYARSAMGMPDSETALEVLTCRVLGHLVQAEIVAKIADGLYCGGNTQEQLIHNWERVLDALQKSSLNLSASKTIIAPSQATILGWTWELGTIRTNKHCISTLLGCNPSQTVTALRSFIGAYKVLFSVVQCTSQLLAPLDDVVAGNDPKDIVVWIDELLAAFQKAQEALTTNKTITLSRPSDQL